MRLTLGQQIKKIRAAKQLSQPILAEAVGIEQSYLSKLENDKSTPSNEIFRKLLIGLDVSIDELLSPVDRNFILEHLGQISDVAQWKKKKHYSAQSLSRRILIVSSALIALGCTFFSSGFSKVIFPTTQYEYISKGIVKTNEPFDYFEGGAYETVPRKEHYAIDAALRSRYSPHEIKTFNAKGTGFLLDVESGIRQYVLVQKSEIHRLENSFLQAFGFFLFIVGILGFVLERRLYQIKLV